MDVRERADPGRTTRCPYCHDLLAVEAAQVECGGCGTQHHAACLEELGRCTVLGCAWTPSGAPSPPSTASRPSQAARRTIAERVARRARDYQQHRAEGAAERPATPPTLSSRWPAADLPPLHREAPGPSLAERQDQARRKLARDLKRIEGDIWTTAAVVLVTVAVLAAGLAVAAYQFGGR